MNAVTSLLQPIPHLSRPECTSHVQRARESAIHLDARVSAQHIISTRTPGTRGGTIFANGHNPLFPELYRSWDVRNDDAGMTTHRGHKHNLPQSYESPIIRNTTSGTIDFRCFWLEVGGTTHRRVWSTYGKLLGEARKAAASSWYSVSFLRGDHKQFASLSVRENRQQQIPDNYYATTQCWEQ